MLAGFSVWKVRWLNIMVVRRRIHGELHRLNVGSPSSERLRRPVHVVHDGSVSGQDDREPQKIRGIDQLAVICGKYRLLRKIAAGGFGVVYEAVQEALDRKVAVKLRLPRPAADEAPTMRSYDTQVSPSLC